MHLAELKAKSPADLLSFAESLQIENASSLRKQDIMFAILKNLAENDQAIHGEGTLEIHSHRGQNGPALDEATLTGPSGQRYDLLHHSALPGGRDWNDTI